MTERAAVLGSPIAHSLSPALHTAGYRALGLDEWEYTRADVAEHELVEFVAGLGPEWRGLSLTRPLKEVAFEVASLLHKPTERPVGVRAAGVQQDPVAPRVRVRVDPFADGTGRIPAAHRQ